VQKLDEQVEGLQTGECFARHRAGKHIPANDDAVHARLADIREHGLQGGEIAVHVIQGGKSHGWSRAGFVASAHCANSPCDRSNAMPLPPAQSPESFRCARLASPRAHLSLENLAQPLDL
jgi:hypothetical protein